MQKIILCRGVPSSGKSTWTKQFILENKDYKRVNKDEIRLMLSNKSFLPAQEDLVQDIFISTCKHILLSGHSLVVDNTNLKQKYIDEIHNLVKEVIYESGYQLKILLEEKWFPVHVDDAIRRDAARGGKYSVGEKVIRRMYENYVSCGGPEATERDVVVKPPEYNIQLPDCIICDLDGTLADSSWRSPYDASQCDKDPLIIPVADVIKGYMYNESKQVHIIFMSGREDKYREPTDRFLQTYSLNEYHSLLMRKSGDMRRDSIVKRELYEEHIKGKYNVLFVIDDRPQVIREAWQKLGLFVFNVGDGVEF